MQRGHRTVFVNRLTLNALRVLVLTSLIASSASAGFVFEASPAAATAAAPAAAPAPAPAAPALAPAAPPAEQDGEAVAGVVASLSPRYFHPDRVNNSTWTVTVEWGADANPVAVAIVAPEGFHLVPDVVAAVQASAAAGESRRAPAFPDACRAPADEDACKAALLQEMPEDVRALLAPRAPGANANLPCNLEGVNVGGYVACWQAFYAPLVEALDVLAVCDGVAPVQCVQKMPTNLIGGKVPPLPDPDAEGAASYLLSAFGAPAPPGAPSQGDIEAAAAPVLDAIAGVGIPENPADGIPPPPTQQQIEDMLAGGQPPVGVPPVDPPGVPSEEIQALLDSIDPEAPTVPPEDDPLAPLVADAEEAVGGIQTPVIPEDPVDSPSAPDTSGIGVDMLTGQTAPEGWLILPTSILAERNDVLLVRLTPAPGAGSVTIPLRIHGALDDAASYAHADEVEWTVEVYDPLKPAGAGGVPATRTLKLPATVDLTAPEMAYAFDPPAAESGWFTDPSGTALTVTAFDPEFPDQGIHVNATLDGVELAGAAGALVVPIATEGVHEWTANATDEAFNLNGTLDAAPNLVRVDFTPPTVAASLDGAQGADGWFVEPPTLTLVVDDATSGPGAASFGIGAADAPYDGPAVVTAPHDGPHELAWLASDVAGNENASAIPFKVDLTDPSVAVAEGAEPAATGWYTAPLAVAASASDTAVDGSVALEVSVDGADFAAYAEPVTLTDGERAVAFRATDAAGRQTTVTRAYRVDATPPTVAAALADVMREDAAGGPYTADTQISLVPDASDATSGVDAYRVVVTDAEGAALSTGEWLPVAAGLEVILPDADGTYGVRLDARDAAGHVAQADAGLVTLDRAPVPVGTVTLADPVTGSTTLTNSLDVTVSVGLTEEEAARVYRWAAGELPFAVPADDSAEWRVEPPPTADAPATVTLAAGGGAAREVVVHLETPAGVRSSGTGVITIDRVAPTAIAFALADLDTGSTEFTNSLDVAPALTASEAFVAFSLDGTAEEAGAWTSATALPATVTLDAAEDGDVTVHLWLRDAAGNAAHAGEATVTLDRAAPTAPEFSLADLDGLAADGVTNARIVAVALDAAGSDASGVQYAISLSETLPSDAAWADALPETITLPAGDGEHVVRVWARDAAGNVVAEPATAAITLDTAPPEAPTVLRVTDPDSGSGTHTNGRRLTVSLDGPGGAAAFIVTVNDEAAPSEATAGWAHPITEVFLADDLADGAVVLRAYAKDAAGNVNPTPISVGITLDTKAPAIDGFAVVDPDAPVAGYANAELLLLEGAATESVAAHRVEVVGIDVGAWTDGAMPTMVDLGDAADGPVTVRVHLRDLAGNEAVAGEAIVTLDRVAPAPPAIIARDLDGLAESGRTNALTIALVVEEPASDANPIQYQVTEGTAPAPDAWVDALPENFTLAPGDGARTLSVWTRDAAGNRPAAHEATVVLDTAAPAATSGFRVLDADSGVEALANDRDVRLEYASAPDAASWLVTVDEADAPAEADARWTATPPAALALASDLADGAHDVRLWVKDAAGNLVAAPAVATLTLDTTAPAATVFVVRDADSGSVAYVNDDSAAVDAAVSADVVAVSLDGTADAPGTWLDATAVPATLDLAAREDGPVTIYLWLRDAAGNAARAGEAAFALDRVAPTAPLVVLADVDAAAGAGHANDDVVALRVTTPSSDASPVQYASSAGPDLGPDAVWLDALPNRVRFVDAADGEHELRVWVRDAAGNLNPEPAVARIVLDRVVATPSLSVPALTGPTLAADLLVDAVDVSEAFLVALDGPAPTAVAADDARFAPLEELPADVAVDGADGARTVLLAVRDRAGNVAFATSATTLDATPPALAGVVGEKEVIVGSPLALTAPAATDASGVAAYAWWFEGVGGVAGESATVTFSQTGEKAAFLNVTDEAGNVASLRFAVQVYPVPPPSGTAPAAAPPPPPPAPRVAFVSEPAAPVVGAAVRFDAGATGAPGSTVSSYTWHFGDGSSLRCSRAAGCVGTNGAAAADGEDGGKVARHAYANPGTYLVSLTVTTSAGASGSAARDVVVAAATDAEPSPGDLPPAPGGGEGAAQSIAERLRSLLALETLPVLAFTDADGDGYPDAISDSTGTLDFPFVVNDGDLHVAVAIADGSRDGTALVDFVAGTVRRVPVELGLGHEVVTTSTGTFLGAASLPEGTTRLVEVRGPGGALPTARVTLDDGFVAFLAESPGPGATFVVVGAGGDESAPVTTADAPAAPVRAPFELVLKTESGATTFWRTSPTMPFQEGDRVPLSGEGDVTVEYYSVDAAGNEEAPQSLVVTLLGALRISDVAFESAKPAPGEAAAVRARVAGAAGAVTALATGPAGSEPIRVELSPSEDGLYRGSFVPPRGGTYALSLVDGEGTGTLVVPEPLERASEPPEETPAPEERVPGLGAVGVALALAGVALVVGARRRR